MSSFADLFDLLVEEGGERVGDEEAAEKDHQEAENKKDAADRLDVGGVGVIVGGTHKKVI